MGRIVATNFDGWTGREYVRTAWSKQGTRQPLRPDNVTARSRRCAAAEPAPVVPPSEARQERGELGRRNVRAKVAVLGAGLVFPRAEHLGPHGSSQRFMGRVRRHGGDRLVGARARESREPADRTRPTDRDIGA